MTAGDFANALDSARRGVVVTDTGADDRLEAALADIATDGPAPEREAEARAAFSSMR